MTLHPAVRIVLLLVLAAALPDFPVTKLAALLAAALLARAALDGAAGVRATLASLWALRWLLAAIATLYLGFTDGTPLWSALPGLSREGATEAARRALLLADLVVAVQLLVLRADPRELVAALAWLVGPLRALRLDPQRFARRLGLALEQTGAVRARLQARAAPGGWADEAVALLRQIERGADATRMPDHVLAAPPLWQWAAPVALLIAVQPWPS